jgi:dolichol-phosphate mannosyltransferase
MCEIEASYTALAKAHAEIEEAHFAAVCRRKSVIILPTFNEAPNLPKLLETLMNLPVDLLFIDDHSTDGSTEILRNAAHKRPENIYLIERPTKLGLGSAYVAGFKWALARGYERILEMDADFSHDPKDIQQLLLTTESYDLAVGSRYLGRGRVLNWPLSRLLLSLCAARYVRAILGLPLSDPTSGFKCFRRSALLAIDLDGIRSNGYSFQIEINYHIWKMGLSIGEAPIIFTGRSEGTSKMSLGIVLEALCIVWRLAIKNWLHMLEQAMH